ncbi:hypothetical protein BDZ94DRAFT_1248777 [Collybia nuda]|uniref:Uncharacterized protein n=1 Tax=Collybia nuda TaxID=64659 RepID=A0A9P5YF11_9AGAR|nr:hypothetical protein BDZ94DRAFT_1248777 [Collybia nuda]
MNCGFQGVLCVQIYTYYIGFPNDKIFFKILIYVVFALETVQTAITTRDAYVIFVDSPRSVGSLGSVRTIWFSFPVIGGLVAFIGQMFFAYRIKILSMSWIPTAIVTLFAVCAMVAAISTGAEAFIAGELSGLHISENYITCGIWNGSSAVCDILITAYMFYYLSRHVSHNSSLGVRS